MCGFLDVFRWCNIWSTNQWETASVEIGPPSSRSRTHGGWLAHAFLGAPWCLGTGLCSQSLAALRIKSSTENCSHGPCLFTQNDVGQWGPCPLTAAQGREVPKQAPQTAQGEVPGLGSRVWTNDYKKPAAVYALAVKSRQQIFLACPSHTRSS